MYYQKKKKKKKKKKKIKIKIKRVLLGGSTINIFFFVVCGMKI